MTRRFENDEEIKQTDPIILISCLLAPVDLEYITLDQRRLVAQVVHDWAEKLP